MRKILAALLLFISVPVAAQNANFGFESGNYTNWTVSNGSTTVKTGGWSDNGSGAQVTTGMNNYCPGGGKCWTVTPYGTYMLAIQAGGGSPSFDSSMSTLGFTSAETTSIKNTIYQNGNMYPTNASFARRSVVLEAGKTYTYAWNYVSTDYTPYNDGSMVVVTGPAGPVTVNGQQKYALLGFTNPGTGNYSTGSYGSTGWQQIVITVTVTGTYDLAFISFNLGDTALSPILFIDEIIGATQLNGQNFTSVQPNSGSTAPPPPAPTPPGPTYCCGGSGDSFSASTVNTNKVNTFSSRTVKDSKVIIEQIGFSNSITVTQSGTRENYFKYYSSGNNNTTTATQSGTSNAVTNYMDLTVNGSNNNLTLSQTGTGGAKGIFATVANNNNTINIQQQDSGNHYLDLSLSGGNKSVTVLQQGSAGHMALINLSGNPTSLSLTQVGATQNFYSITHSCATAGGCGTITVTQGQ
jgi:hypothetical protein